MLSSSYKPVLELTRGNLTESIHFGAIAVTNSHGELIAHYGNPHLTSFMRSSAKPLQAIALIEREGHKHFSFTPAQIALICASHSGTDAHVSELNKMLQKIGSDESELLCGEHPPIHVPTMIAMHERGEKTSPIRNNCSGKHIGMIALAKLLGINPSDYVNKSHPIQEIILKVISDMSDVPVSDIELGIDGCSVPTFAIPLYNAAYAFAKLCDPSSLSKSRESACRTIVSAMASHPDMVGGSERFDTDFMLASSQIAISKMGAEGYLCLGFPPDEDENRPNGIGIAIKIADGDGKGRTRPAIALETIRQLGWLKQKEANNLSKYGPTKSLHNLRNLKIGEMHPCFTLIHDT